jgi:biopolymer transport protein ExbB
MMNGNLWEKLNQGGPVVYVLLGVSVLGVAFFFYCLLLLRRRTLFPAPLVALVETIKTEADCLAAEKLCRAVGGALAEVLMTVVVSRRLPRDEVNLLVEGAGRRVMQALSRGIMALEIVAAISPLLGLLGTVTGMYAVFETLALNAGSEASRLSGGIAEALITTIVGLVIAIPAYVAYSYFAHRVEELVLEMERLALELMLRLRGEGIAGEQ